jgi:flagellar biosynthesis/type III secretory pathway M-ring protein FliF/YscJ
METIRNQLVRIQEQIGALTASQKMLTASLVVIMVMTILWWGRYAGTAELVPLMEQALPAAQMGQIKNALDSRGIEARIIGDRIMVPAERKAEAMIILASSDALPDNASSIWDEMAKQMSPWDSTSRTSSIQNHTKERMLSEALSSYLPGVAKAAVFINPVSERRVQGSLEPSAAVQITTRNGDVNMKRLAEAVASTVSSAVSGLKKSRVSVVINGLHRQLQDSSTAYGGGDLYETIDAEEKRIADKILGVLGTHALVAVTVNVETDTAQQTTESYDPSKSVSKETEIKTESSESQQPAPGGAEDAGAVPNMGLALQAAAQQGGPTNTMEKSETRIQNFVGKTTETIHRPPGKPTVVSAAVRLPRAYFVARYRIMNPNVTKEPDDAALQSLVTAEIPAVRNHVKMCTAIKSDDDISVDMYYDGGVMMLAGIAGSGGAESSGPASGIGGMIGGRAKELVLGALAVISLFMVSMIVKKGAPAPVAAIEAGPKETPRLATGEAVAGIVGGDGNATLDGMELDEESVKSQQMVEQVATMVSENPDAAANLVKRWLNRD